jgi:hypothetical protein
MMIAEIAASQPTPSEAERRPDRGFDTAMVIARCRWNLALEAHG